LRSNFLDFVFDENGFPARAQATKESLALAPKQRKQAEHTSQVQLLDRKNSKL
jgi:hypothetical protein